MRTLPPQNMILIDVFYQILLDFGDPILLDGLKMGDEVVDQLGLGSIFVGHGADEDFILDCKHKC